VSWLELVPFADEHLGDAAQLLAERHARHRKVEPLLPERYEGPAAALEELERAWRADDASGAAALRAGRLTGYLIAAPREPEVWGENTWVELAGQAVEEPEVIRDLYGFAASRWVEEGRMRHYALAPLDPTLVDAWFRLSFGQQQAHGYREVHQSAEVQLPEGCEIHQPDESEIDELIEVGLALPSHQRASPVFSSRPLPTEEELRQEWIDTLKDGEEEILICKQNGRPVACWSFVAAERSRHYHGLALPERACYLGYAATVPESRGTGIGVALTEIGLAWAADQGHRAMVTDWRVTNLLASRFWPKRGFRPAILRLYRSIP
jgi:GNAT superfamily N-acetyltransferase